MTKLGTEFEVFTKSLYEELLNQQKLKNLKVEHNVKLKGASRQYHQIDVYWEFEIAGSTHKVAVECKDYKGLVPIGKIRDFAAALDDIGGIKGIFITRNGYQSGAVNFAKSKKIELKTIKNTDITHDDFKGSGFITSIQLNAHALLIDNIKYNFEFDMKYLIQNNPKELLTSGEIKIEGGTEKIFISNKDKTQVFSLQSLCNDLPRQPTNTKNLYFEKDLTDDIYFIDYPNRKLLVKINKIKLSYDTIQISESFIHEAKLTAKAIIKDILNNTCEVVGIKKLI